jgi:hypothetical protein
MALVGEVLELRAARLEVGRRLAQPGDRHVPGAELLPEPVEFGVQVFDLFGS